VTGVKRHLCVDTLGLGWGLAVTPANESDSIGARRAVLAAKKASDRLVHVWADSAYQGFVRFALLLLAMTVAIVTRRPGAVGFEVQPRRWVVERTFGWLVSYRRLGKDYEVLTETSEAMIRAAMIHLMLRRLPPPG
jgi:putative transposase